MVYNIIMLLAFAGVSFSDDKEYSHYVPADGEIRAFVNDILQKEMPSQLDTFKEDLEKYFKIVCLIFVCSYSLIDCTSSWDSIPYHDYKLFNFSLKRRILNFVHFKFCSDTGIIHCLKVFILM